ncbi:histidine kinase 4-like [Dorcoceras hygrometricum]|uniref:Histidine kinase 4-like n=1 Tax=Dorcoceras hygrometricum TaxID=472368 RepID=A0A2Z7B5F8_9LAMI|nr:histidine kinase 4-like [Dorcoceras hygrometricum]
MSLFDLQDVCMAIGSIATLDLPMVVDLIGIYGLKGPYCTLTTTNWLLQALSVIPRGSWGDVARRFTMIRWADATLKMQRSNLSKRHRTSYIILSVDRYLATGSSNHRLVAHPNATAETSSQHSKMLTNTCLSLDDSGISAPAASSNHLQTPLLPADNNTSRLLHLY